MEAARQAFQPGADPMFASREEDEQDTGASEQYHAHPCGLR